MYYIIYLLTLIPAYELFSISSEIDPYDKWLEITGIWATIWLSIAILLGPLARRAWFGYPNWGRKPVGLAGATWIGLHIVGYFVLHANMWRGLIDLVSVPYLVIGLVGAIILLLMTITSRVFMIKLIGVNRWKSLHKAVVVACTLGAAHGLTAQKVVFTPAGGFAMILLVSVLLRYIFDGWRYK